jgi:DNA-binding transcriptional MerR regulator
MRFGGTMVDEKERTFTTGQVSGITWLTQQALYKYTQEFPHYFSETATQHKKGRRWTSSDLKTIQAIRTLKHSRLGHVKIAGALAAGYRDELRPNSDREEFSRLAATLFERMDQDKELLEKAIRELEVVHAFENKINHLEKHLDALTEHTVKLTNISKWARMLHIEYQPPKTKY